MRPFFCIALVLAAAADGDSLAQKSGLAQQAMQAGQYGKAALLFREMLKELPGNPGLRMNLAVALDKAGQPSAAITEAERVTRATPTNAAAWLLLGLAYQQLNQPQRALAPLREASRLEPKNPTARLELADAELTTGDPRSSAKDFEVLAQLQPDSPKAWEGTARAHLSLSETSFHQLESQWPGSPFHSALLASARAQEQRYGEALALYAAALKSAPDIPGIHAARAQLYRATQHDDWAAIEDEREAQITRPDCAAHPAACAYIQQDWPRTLSAAAKTHSAENLYWTAQASARVAEESLKKLAMFPESAELHAVLADANQRTGRRLEAITEWRKALALKPGDALLRGRLAESLFLAREYPEAEQILTGLVAQQPENSEWQFHLGNVLLQLKRSEEALPHLVIATTLSPALLPAQEALGRVYLDLDKPELAVAHLEKARPLDQGSISFALSSTYRKLGRASEAKAALARYQELTKNQPAAAMGKDLPIPAP